MCRIAQPAQRPGTKTISEDDFEISSQIFSLSIPKFLQNGDEAQNLVSIFDSSQLKRALVAKYINITWNLKGGLRAQWLIVSISKIWFTWPLPTQPLFNAPWIHDYKIWHQETRNIAL